MPTPEELEARADALRGYSRSARLKAQSLATHIDTLVKRCQDDDVWKGAYPDAAAADAAGFQRALGRSADLLGLDADAWEIRARRLDEQAEVLRAEQRRRAAQAEAEEQSPTGGRPR